MKISEDLVDLVEKIKKRRCVVFVGAGLSRDAGLPGWEDLLDKMIDWQSTRVRL